MILTLGIAAVSALIAFFTIQKAGDRELRPVRVESRRRPIRRGAARL
jgi:hypothetical protein